jgi:hypothetical protein
MDGPGSLLCQDGWEDQPDFPKHKRDRMDGPGSLLCQDGRVLDEPVKFNDHALDAMRYAAFTKLSKPKSILIG